MIDKSILIAPKIVESPILGSISHEWISGGAKQLIMMNCEQYIVYDGDNLGDNCWELLLELGQTKDIMMSLSYYPRFSWIPGGKVHILNSDITVTDFKSFNKLHLMTEDRNREFDFYEVHWPFPIDMTKFAPVIFIRNPMNLSSFEVLLFFIFYDHPFAAERRLISTSRFLTFPLKVMFRVQ